MYWKCKQIKIEKWTIIQTIFILMLGRFLHIRKSTGGTRDWDLKTKLVQMHILKRINLTDNLYIIIIVGCMTTNLNLILKTKFCTCIMHRSVIMYTLTVYVRLIFLKRVSLYIWKKNVDFTIYFAHFFIVFTISKSRFTSNCNVFNYFKWNHQRKPKFQVAFCFFRFCFYHKTNHDLASNVCFSVLFQERKS